MVAEKRGRRLRAPRVTTGCDATTVAVPLHSSHCTLGFSQGILAVPAAWWLTGCVVMQVRVLNSARSGRQSTPVRLCNVHGLCNRSFGPKIAAPAHLLAGRHIVPQEPAAKCAVHV